MTSDIQKPILIRTAMILLLIFVLVFSTFHFLRNITSATDENVFNDPVSRYYLTQELTAFDTTAGRFYPKEKINAGMLIISIDEIKLNNYSNIKEILKNDKKYHSITYYNTLNKSKKTSLVNAEEFTSESLSYLNSAVEVIEVIPGGVSDRAGMKVGDIIIKINGKQFQNMYIADRHLAAERANELMKYDILRANSIITLNLIPVKFGLPFILLFFNLASILSIIFGAFMVLKRPNIKASMILGFGLVLFGFSLMIAASRFTPYFKPDFFLFLRSLVLFFTQYLAYAVMTYSVYFFPIPVPRVSEMKWIPVTLASIAMTLFVIYLLNSLIFLNNTLAFIPENGLFLFIAFIIFIRTKYRKHWTEEYKKLHRPIAVMYIVVLIIRVLSPFIVYNLNLPVQLPNYLFVISFIVLLITYYYIIARHNLLNLNIRIKRNIQYTLISIFWRIIAVASIILIIYALSNVKIKIPNLNFEGTSIEVLNSQLSPAKQYFYEKLILVASALVLTLLVWKMKGSVQKTLDRIFFRNTFDYRRASTDMASILARNITLGDLASNITNELADLSHLKRVGIVIFRNETNLVAQNFHGVRNTELGELLTASGAKLSESIKPFKEDFSVDFIQEPLGGILKEFGFKHIQPVYSKNKLLGALIIGEKKSEASINRDDFTFLQTIAGQIAVAIDNSFLYEEITQKERMKHELDIAKRIQLASLPGKVPNVEGLEISGTSIPAFEVGGDFYDYLETDNGDFMVIVGDVSGKGTSAALYMSKIQGIMRTLHEFRLSPRKLLVRTNHLLYSYLEKGYFVSSTAANFNTSTRKVQISRAGHLPLYYFSSSNNKLVKITTKGMVLGLTQDKTFERNMDEDEINYQTGDIFIFITDGIIDSKNTMMQDFGEERFIRTINNTIDMSAENIRNAIIESAKTFAGEEEQFDDMTVVVVKIIN